VGINLPRFLNSFLGIITGGGVLVSAGFLE
jgi:hypothetical protein